MLLNKTITNEAEFHEILKKICSEIDNGLLEQCLGFDDFLCTKEDIHKFVSERKYPDYIRLYFKEIETSHKFLLEVETYHGIGGCFRRLDG